MAHIDGTGIISGTVSEDGVPKAGAIVTVYDRDTNDIVYRGECGSGGEYTFSGLNHLTNSYYVTAKDDDGVTRKNALIEDYVQPVNGAVGTSYNENWFIELKQSNPIFLFAGTELNAQNELSPLNLTSQNSNLAITAGANLGAGSWSLASQTTTIGAPNLKSINVVNGYFTANAPVNHIDLSFGISNLYSLAMGLETSFFSIVRTDQPFSAQIISNDNSLFVPFRLSLSSTFVITIQALNSSTNVTVLTYTLPSGSLRTGFHSIGFSIDGSATGQVDLYIDGVLVGTAAMGTEKAPLVTTNGTNPYGTNLINGLRFSGFNTGSAMASITTGTFSIITSAIQLRFLTSAEHLSLHNSFMVSTAPKVTGYVKEVTSDLPSALYLLSDPTDSRFKEYFNSSKASFKMPNGDTMLKARGSGVTPGKLTPVLGRYGTRFTKQGLIETNFESRNSGFSPVGFNKWGFTLEFWIRLESVPVENSYIIAFNAYNALQHSLSVTTDRKLSLFLSSTVNETITLTPVLAVGTFYHVAITVNRPSGSLKVYLNGALVESRSTGLTALTSLPVNTGPVGMLSIGGYRNFPSRRLSGLLDATLLGIAFYGNELTLARVQAHYDARLIA